MIYVYSVIMNGWDNLRSPAVPVEDGVRYICYTNLPHLPRVHPWEYRPLYSVSGHPARTSRVPKILPHLMLPYDTEYSIYHDGNFQLKVSPIAMIESLLKDHDWAAHKHPCRDCVYEEGEILIRERIGTTALVEEEMARYRVRGYPVHAGLWANGMLVRRHTAGVATLNELWWDLYSSGCERDQTSFPVARYHEEMEIRTIDEDVYRSPYLLQRWHAAWKDRDDNPDYWEERARLRGRLGRLERIAGPGAGVSYPEY